MLAREVTADVSSTAPPMETTKAAKDQPVGGRRIPRKGRAMANIGRARRMVGAVRMAMARAYQAQ